MCHVHIFIYLFIITYQNVSEKSITKFRLYRIEKSVTIYMTLFGKAMSFKELVKY